MLSFLRAKKEENQLFSPSSFSRLVAVPHKSSYKERAFKKREGIKPVLVLCTENGAMEMKNGKAFQTGNHPLELIVPLLHLKSAGIPFEIVTISGKSVVIEEWALPKKDQNVLSLFNNDDFKRKLKSPKSVGDVLNDIESYSGVFIPGGHGAMLDLPENEKVGELLKKLHSSEKTIASLCHGPAVLLAAGETFKGYTIAAFPDAMDKFTPFIGYLPGEMPWYFGEELKKRGLNILGSLGMGKCYRDRKLVTGDGPQAADKFGVMMAESLLEG